MANASALPSNSLVESASTLFRSGSPEFGLASETPFRRNISFDARQERAMARRLEQIESALGVTEPSSKLSLVPEPTVTATATQTDRRFSGLTLLATSLFSGFVGATLMWLTTSHEAPTPLPAAPETRLVIPAATVPVQAAATSIAPTPGITEEQLVRDQLESWRNAWAKCDVDSYLSAYSASFSPADGSTRDHWASTRKTKLASGKNIDVQVNELKVERVDDRTFRASFRQDYASGSYREKASPKTMLFAREGKEWKIIEERQLETVRSSK